MFDFNRFLFACCICNKENSKIVLPCRLFYWIKSRDYEMLGRARMYIESLFDQ